MLVIGAFAPFVSRIPQGIHDRFHPPSEEPAPKSALDATLRRSARLSYHGFIVGCFLIAIVAIACALAPALCDDVSRGAKRSGIDVVEGIPEG